MIRLAAPTDRAAVTACVRDAYEHYIERIGRDEGGMRKAQVIEQNAKRLFADHSLSNVLVAVEFGAARGLGVVAVPDLHVVQANGRV